jgi:hypothetical protein
MLGLTGYPIACGPISRWIARRTIQDLEMARSRTQALRLFAVAAFTLCAGGLAQAQSLRQPEPPLQQVADEAALKAVQVLGIGGNSEQAVAVAQEAVASASGLSAQVRPSSDKSKVTVKITLSAESKETIVGTARYIPPEQPPQWAWATRQRFVAKSSPVIVGSNCGRGGCEPPQ